jgi:hypothetical protein
MIDEFDERVEKTSKFFNLKLDDPLVFKIIIMESRKEMEEKLKLSEIEERLKHQFQLEVQKLQLELQYGLEQQKLKSEIQNLERNLLVSKGAATCRGIFEFVLKAAKEELQLKGNFNAAIVCNTLQQQGTR